MKEKQTFKSWLKEMTKIAPKYGWKCDPVEGAGAESWRGFFDDGYSPAEALLEDASYG